MNGIGTQRIVSCANSWEIVFVPLVFRLPAACAFAFVLCLLFFLWCCFVEAVSRLGLVAVCSAGSVLSSPSPFGLYLPWLPFSLLVWGFCC